jgi:sulfite dehydrogenase
MMQRRTFLNYAGNLVGSAIIGNMSLSKVSKAEDFVTLPFDNGARPLVRYPGKRPLIQLTARPPQLETPFSVFNEGVITPNDAFFVRYHLSDIPLSIDPDAFRLNIKGKIDRALSLSLSDLKNDFEPVEIVAVNQCSGNSRGFFNPRVAGGQLANGAMGNARWKGVSLRHLLDKAGVQAGVKNVTFAGLDEPVNPQTPDVVKALDIDHARNGEVIIAYSMNGEDLPWLNGYPLRLIVPGYYGTYWLKHLNEIVVIDTDFNGYWIEKGYRIPANSCACTEPGATPLATVPINRFNVRSFITNFTDNAHCPVNTPTTFQGIAFDGGYGISEVLLSIDDGQSWLTTTLGKDYGNYSFREWQATIKLTKGLHNIKVCATNRIGQSQPQRALWNPAGYMRNVVETVRVIAS